MTETMQAHTPFAPSVADDAGDDQPPAPVFTDAPPITTKVLTDFYVAVTLWLAPDAQWPYIYEGKAVHVTHVSMQLTRDTVLTSTVRKGSPVRVMGFRYVGPEISDVDANVLAPFLTLPAAIQNELIEEANIVVGNLFWEPPRGIA